MKEIEWRAKNSSTLKLQYWNGTEYETFEINSKSPIDTVLVFSKDITDYYLIEDKNGDY